jgi:GT2 family glycosyltransferase
VIKVKPKFSIIIPTLNHLEDCLKPCCDSIIATTTLENVEVIVVGNGCTDGSKAYVESLGKPFKFLDFPNPLGYAKANNEGLAVAKGDYFILLNNDTVLLGQEKDTWINQLLDAFNKVQNCGISGPMRSFSYDANSTFLIFFCVCISRKCFESVGYLDESFKEGAGEDIAYCVEAIRKNFALVQVPNDEKLKYAEGYGSGGFPIWHKAEKTVHGLSNWSEIFSRNMAMLKNRYNS